MEDPSRLSYKIKKALRNPGRIIPFLKKYFTFKRIAASSKGHLDYYGKLVDLKAQTNPDLAVGSTSKDSWLSIGELQFNYLVKHGLQPNHHFLDLGCGNLRAGWRIIDYLEGAKYTGVDISSEIIRAAAKTLVDKELMPKRPYLYLVGDTHLEFLPSGYFDVVHAHSVYTHCPEEVIRSSMLGVKRVLRPEGFFDFTILEINETSANILEKDFYYSVDVIRDLAEGCGYTVQVMDDWTDHPHTKIRARIS